MVIGVPKWRFRAMPSSDKKTHSTMKSFNINPLAEAFKNAIANEGEVKSARQAYTETQRKLEALLEVAKKAYAKLELTSKDLANDLRPKLAKVPKQTLSRWFLRYGLRTRSTSTDRKSTKIVVDVEIVGSMKGDLKVPTQGTLDARKRIFNAYVRHSASPSVCNLTLRQTLPVHSGLGGFRRVLAKVLFPCPIMGLAPRLSAQFPPIMRYFIISLLLRLAVWLARPVGGSPVLRRAEDYSGYWLRRQGLDRPFDI